MNYVTYWAYFKINKFYQQNSHEFIDLLITEFKKKITEKSLRLNKFEKFSLCNKLMFKLNLRKRHKKLKSKSLLKKYSVISIQTQIKILHCVLIFE